jgi:hypothetical protein
LVQSAGAIASALSAAGSTDPLQTTSIAADSLQPNSSYEYRVVDVTPQSHWKGLNDAA